MSVFPLAGSTARTAWDLKVKLCSFLAHASLPVRELSHRGEVNNSAYDAQIKTEPSSLSHSAAEPAQLTGVTSSKISLK